MKLLGIQILGIVFGLFMLYVAFLHQKRKEFTVKEHLFWTLFSVAFIMLILFPGILDPITETLKFSRTMDLFIVLGFMFLIGALFYVYVIVRKTQNKIEEVVRQVAFKRLKK